MAKTFPLEPGWQIVLKDLGVDARAVLKRAELPDDLMSRNSVMLTPDEYFRLWSALEAEAADPLLPLRIGRNVPAEAFTPPIFAALCSPHLVTASERIARYKRLCAPMALSIEDESKAFTIAYEWLDGVQPPQSLVVFELVFMVHLVRTATRENVVPVRLETTRPPDAPAYRDYFGLPVRKAKRHAVSFRPADARLPFLTANEAMWEAFEPSLRQRLSELDASATTTDRVRAVLLEALPSGSSSIEDVARRLAMSKRTLQRRLKGEDTNFQAILNQTREELALHYLRRTELSGAEISYLLGFEDPNSFFRAFHEWTGSTTESVRLRA
jgi:AraC-like DNA-binding protein